jgi:hypothetical protein
MKVRTHLTIIALEYLFIPGILMLAFWVQHRKGVIPFVIGVIYFYGFVIVAYAFGIQVAFLAKKILAKKFPAFRKIIFIIPAFVMTFIASLLLYSASEELIGRFLEWAVS